MKLKGKITEEQEKQMMVNGADDESQEIDYVYHSTFCLSLRSGGFCYTG